MKSKIKIAGHPIHPMLVAFPIAFYTAAMATYITYMINNDPFWFRVAYIANVAGVLLAIVAAVPGFLDWLMAIPKRSVAKRTGVVHMSLHVFALVCFSLNWWMQSAKWNDIQPEASASVFLSIVGVLSTIAGGIYGWTLVQTHHLGVYLTAEQERLEPDEQIKTQVRGVPPTTRPASQKI